jgi:hypothetical protein
VVRTVLVDTPQCRKQVCAAVNQHATIEEAVFSVGAAPRLYNEISRSWNENWAPELAVAEGN